MLQTEGRNYKLAKNQYEGYQYIDLDNFYTYENSFVLINKQTILDPNLAKNIIFDYKKHIYLMVYVFSFVYFISTLFSFSSTSRLI